MTAQWVYDSKAISNADLASCRFDLFAHLIGEGWEYNGKQGDVTYFRKRVLAYHSPPTE